MMTASKYSVVRDQVKKRLFEMADAVSVNMIQYSGLRSGLAMFGNDIDLVVDPRDQDAFIDILRQFDAVRASALHGYKEEFLVHHEGMLFSLDVRWGMTVCIEGKELWRLPMPERSARIRLPDGGYRPHGSVWLPFLAALFSSIDKSVFILARDGWNDKNRQKWSLYYRENISEVSDQPLRDILADIEEYVRTGEKAIGTQSWFYELRNCFAVEEANITTGRRIRWCPGMNFVVWVEGADGVGKSTLVRNIQYSRWPLSFSKLYLGYGEHGWKFALARIVALDPPKWLVRFPRLLAFFQTFIFLPIEMARRQIGVWLQAGRSLVLVDRVPLKIVASRSIFVRTLYRYLFPMPDLIVLLYGDPKVIAERKPHEVTPLQVQRLTKEAKDRLGSVHGTRTMMIDTTKHSVEEVADMVMREILASMGGFSGLRRRFQLTCLGKAVQDDH